MHNAKMQNGSGKTVFFVNIDSGEEWQLCKKSVRTPYMWVVQVQKDLVDLSKHYIHEIDALVSLDRAECFALEKKKPTKTVTK